MRETSASESLVEASKAVDDVETGAFTSFREEHGGYPTYWPCDVRCIGGVTLIRALLRNLALFLGNMGSMQRKTRPSMQREDQPTMETKLEQIAASAVNPPIEERSAANPHATFCGSCAVQSALN